MVTKVETVKKPVCPKCGSSYIYIRINGEIVCRRCGYVENKAG